MRRGFGLIWVTITALIAGVASYFSYEAGLSQGLATKLPAGVGAVPGYWYGPHWGVGFFPFGGVIWFFLFLLIFFWIIRGFARAGRHGGWGGGRHYYEERMRDWHRQAHEQGAPSPGQEQPPG